ncbi:ligase-associated DNA damage response endonuclease PdeM [Flavobacteriaceae bacterium MHTCC 0001]
MVIAKEHVLLRGEDLILTNQRVVFWPKKQALILSDLHIGKTAHFRKNGIPIPAELLYKDLERLKHLIHHFNPNTLFIVGDLFHAEFNGDVKVFQKWMQQFTISMVLIKGNHDKNSFILYESLDIEIIQNYLELTPFIFSHDITVLKEDEFYISGHIHPGVLIKGKGRQRIKLPCYQITNQQLVLPAFSLFTGLNTRNNLDNCKNFVFTDNSIFKM